MGKRDEDGIRTTKRDKALKTKQKMGPYSTKHVRLVTLKNVTLSTKIKTKNNNYYFDLKVSKIIRLSFI